MKSITYKIFPFLIILCISVVASPLSLSAKNKEFIVVIDAGHGGNDHGAVDNGVKEKDINLAVALELGDLIKKNLKNTKVIYTRSNDSFVSLQGRADKANKAKGDLFISIHTNSVDAKSKARTTVEGASVYVLGSGADSKNRDVVRRENLVIELEKDKKSYQGFDPNSDESYIMFEMAQKQDLSHSIAFAKLALNELKKTANRKDKGVHQAGFWVLWATSMPSVLVELDFICNPNSAQYLNSDTGRKQLAQSLFNAVKEYYKITDGGRGKLSADIDLSHDNEISDGEETVLASRTAKSERVHLDKNNKTRSTSSSRRRRSSRAAKESENAIQVVADIPITSTTNVEKNVEPQSNKSRQADNIIENKPNQNTIKDKKNKKKIKNSSTHARIDKTLYDENVEKEIAEVAATSPASVQAATKGSKSKQNKTVALTNTQDDTGTEAKGARKRNRKKSVSPEVADDIKVVAEANDKESLSADNQVQLTGSPNKSSSRRKARIDHGNDIAQTTSSYNDETNFGKKGKASNTQNSSESSKKSEKLKTDIRNKRTESSEQSDKAAPKVPRLDKPVNGFYTVQLFTSQSKIKNNDIRLQGLNREAVKVLHHEGKYLYCYGESSDQRSIERLREQLSENYQDAEVLKIGSVK